MSIEEGASERKYSAQAIHLLRTATTVNITLSQMADQKASILMGATFVVFTISVGQAGRGVFPVSLLVLAAFAFLSAIFAVAVVMPKVSPARVSAEPRNILFFGAFTAMPVEQFTDTVLDELVTDERVFRTMLIDIYQNGLVLQQKKYRYLGIAYRIFMAGLAVTMVTFIVESRNLVATLVTS